MVVLVNAVVANLGPSVQDTIEKARMSIHKEVTKHLTAEVKVNILVSDPFHP